MNHAPGADSPPPRLSDPCQRRREQILDAAARLFAEQGFDDAATQGLADEIGVGKGTIYRHFPSKEAMFLAAVDRAMGRLRQRMDEAIAAEDDPLLQVSRGVEAFLTYFEDEPEALELLVQERAQFKDRDRPTFQQHREKVRPQWLDRYRRLIADGRVRPMPPDRISDVFAAALYGSVFLRYFSGRPGDFRADAADILDVIFLGILGDAERAERLAISPPPSSPPPQRPSPEQVDAP